MDETLQKLEQTVGHGFGDRQLLLTAMTHPSYAAEQSPPPPDNQRLEFLGDAVLQVLITDLLYTRFPTRAEGVLTKIRSALTNEKALVIFANELELGTHLLLGNGEDRSGGRERASNLADAFEALLGALYLDGGITAARELCNRLANDMLTNLDAVLANENPKGALQELTQKRYGCTPSYDILEVSGPEHDPRFSVRVSVAGEELATASAGSRKGAEKRAAELALEKLTHDGETH